MENCGQVASMRLLGVIMMGGKKEILKIARLGRSGFTDRFTYKGELGRVVNYDFAFSDKTKI
jgi:hypothetical protein